MNITVGVKYIVYFFFKKKCMIYCNFQLSISFVELIRELNQVNIKKTNH
jgi:hypothetical protein